MCNNTNKLHQKEDINKLKMIITQINDLTNKLQYNHYQNSFNEAQQILETFQNDIQSLPPIDIGNISQTFEEIYQSIQQIIQQLVEEDNGSEYDTCEEILDDYYEEKEEIKEMNYCLKVYNDNEEETISKRMHNADAGFDLYYSGTRVLTIPPQQTVLIDTKIAMEIPTRTVCQIFSRSSLAKIGLNVQGDTIDAGYTGNIGILLHNNSQQSYDILPNARIAQAVFL